MMQHENLDPFVTIGRSGIFTLFEEIEICSAIGDWYLFLNKCILDGKFNKKEDLKSALFYSFIGAQLYKNHKFLNDVQLKYILSKFEDWKLKWPFRITDKRYKIHNLGFIKEKLKDMICGYNSDFDDNFNDLKKVSVYSY